MARQIGLGAYTYLPPSEVCPDFSVGSSYTNEFGERVDAKKVGIQGFLNRNRKGSEFAGTCAIWSLWYLHVRLQSPRLGPTEALRKAMGMAVDLDDAKMPEGEAVCRNVNANDGKWCDEDYVETDPKWQYTVKTFKEKWECL